MSAGAVLFVVLLFTIVALMVAAHVFLFRAINHAMGPVKPTPVPPAARGLVTPAPVSRTVMVAPAPTPMVARIVQPALPVVSDDRKPALPAVSDARKLVSHTQQIVMTVRPELPAPMQPAEYQAPTMVNQLDHPVHHAPVKASTRKGSVANAADGPCQPRSSTWTVQQDATPPVEETKPRKRRGRVPKPGSTTYKYRDPEKRREYQRNLMARRRAAEKQEHKQLQAA